MKKIKGNIVLILLAFLLMTAGCAKTEEVSEPAMVLETETESEQEETVTESLDEADETTDADEETESGTEMEIETTAETESEVVPEAIEYSVAPMEEVSMYATNAVNVRKGPATDFERLGSLKIGEEVKVTGQATTGWYEIAYGEEKAFVSDKYLQTEPVPVQQIQQAAVVSTPSVPTTNIVLIGDSRTAEMKNCVGPNTCIWIAEHSQGIKWFVSDAVPAADPYIGPGTKVIINLGANDPQKVDTYIYTINETVANWNARGATVYYATVGPCYQNPYHTIEEAYNFNIALQNGLVGVRWIDLYTYLVSTGFATREDDGFHYDPITYARIFSYYMGCIK